MMSIPLFFNTAFLYIGLFLPELAILILSNVDYFRFLFFKAIDLFLYIFLTASVDINVLTSIPYIGLFSPDNTGYFPPPSAKL